MSLRSFVRMPEDTTQLGIPRSPHASGALPGETPITVQSHVDNFNQVAHVLTHQIRKTKTLALFSGCHFTDLLGK